MFFGGVCQFLAGIIEFVAGNSVSHPLAELLYSLY